MKANTAVGVMGLILGPPITSSYDYKFRMELLGKLFDRIEVEERCSACGQQIEKEGPRRPMVRMTKENFVMCKACSVRAFKRLGKALLRAFCES